MDPLSTVQGRDSAPANTRVAAVPQVAPAANSIYRAPPQNGIPNAAPPIHTGIDNSSWWHKAQLQPVLAKSSQQPISVEQIVLESLQHSLRLQIDATSPQQSQNDIFEAAAEFDWEAFVDSSWRDLTEPSGSQLITGGTRSLRNSEFSYEAGFRRRNQVGGDLSLSQQFGLEDSNSDFFTPPRQGQTRMSLSYTQPLLRGAGRKYNLSGVVRAELNNEIARQEFFTRVQDHLVSVRQAYWDLYYARAFLIQQRKLAQLAGEILHELRLRENVDGAKDQLLRVTASVSSREAALIRAEKDVVDAQAQLRRLVNSPMLLEFVSTEFIPQDTPSWRPSGNNREWLLQQAIQFRPEVISSLREIKVASVQYQVTSNELLPQLNLVLTTYVLGLRGERDINTAFRDQFSSGQPSYSVGLTVEMPWGNRAANARHRNAEIQIQRMKREFQLSVEQVWLEVDSAIRELETSYQEMQAHQIVMRRYNDQLSYLNTRRQWLPQGNRTGSLYLEDLLNAQVRVVDAEMDYLRSQIDFTMAEVSLQRATGTMLR
jgi:outer membrane protein